MSRMRGSQRAGFEDGGRGLRTRSSVEASKVSNAAVYIKRASERGVQGRGVVGKGALRWLAAVLRSVALQGAPRAVNEARLGRLT